MTPGDKLLARVTAGTLAGTIAVVGVARDKESLAKLHGTAKGVLVSMATVATTSAAPAVYIFTDRTTGKQLEGPAPERRPGVTIIKSSV
jgi:hypothetical protein